MVLGGASDAGMLFESGGELCGGGFEIRDLQWEGEGWKGEGEQLKCGDFEYCGLEVCEPWRWSQILATFSETIMSTCIE